MAVASGAPQLSPPANAARGCTRKQYVACAPSLTSSSATRLPGRGTKNQDFASSAAGETGARAMARWSARTPDFVTSASYEAANIGSTRTAASIEGQAEGIAAGGAGRPATGGTAASRR